MARLVKGSVALCTLAAVMAGTLAFAHAQTRVQGGGCSPSIADSSNKAVSGTSGAVTVAAAASLAVPVGTVQTGGDGGGGSQTQSNTAGSASNDGTPTGTSTANTGDQGAGITQSGQCADSGANVGGQNLGIVNVGSSNRGVLNNGDVLGVVVQNLGGNSRLSQGRSSVTTTINATNNVGNANGQAAVGKGSRPNQNSSQTFLSQ